LGTWLGTGTNMYKCLDSVDTTDEWGTLKSLAVHRSGLLSKTTLPVYYYLIYGFKTCRSYFPIQTKLITKIKCILTSLFIVLYVIYEECIIIFPLFSFKDIQYFT
jgi:hypothetical protein